MINIFNRKEVFITLDMHKMAQARDVLSAHGIECIVGTVNLLDYGGVRIQAALALIRASYMSTTCMSIRKTTIGPCI